MIPYNETVEVLTILILTLVASSVGTTTGFGTSTILVPFLSLRYPFPETLLFAGVIHWFGDLWKMLFFKQGVRWKLVLLFAIPGVATAFLAARLPVAIPESWMQRSLGGFLIAYVIYLLQESKWEVKQTSANAILGGGLSGFFAGLFGVGGAVRGAFLSSFNLEKAVYIFTSGAIAFTIDSARIAGYVTSGIRLRNLNLQLLTGSVVVSLAGAYLAKRMVDRIPQNKFRALIAAALLLVGVRYLLF